MVLAGKVLFSSQRVKKIRVSPSILWPKLSCDSCGRSLEWWKAGETRRMVFYVGMFWSHHLDWRVDFSIRVRSGIRWCALKIPHMTSIMTLYIHSLQCIHKRDTSALHSSFLPCLDQTWRIEVEGFCSTCHVSTFGTKQQCCPCGDFTRAATLIKVYFALVVYFNWTYWLIFIYWANSEATISLKN